MEVNEHALKSLQPGFLVMWSVDPAGIRIKGWKEMQKQGWSGGMILRPGEDISSLDEKQMNSLGWYRLQDNKHWETLLPQLRSVEDGDQFLCERVIRKTNEGHSYECWYFFNQKPNGQSFQLCDPIDETIQRFVR